MRALLTTGIFAMWLVGCGADGGGGTRDEPWTTWEELRQAIRTSPDHLEARAEAVVASGDVVAMHAFVRDAIRNAPDERATRLSRSATRVRWGLRGVLRSGQGTFREKAELLASLYQRAGLEAEVVAGPVSLSAEQVAALFAQPAPAFAPEIDGAQWEAWRSALELPEPETAPGFDANGAESAALANALLAQLTGEATPDGVPLWTNVSFLPLVRVKVGADWRFANPGIPGLAFGESGTSRTPSAAEPAVETLPVTVSLSYSTTTDPRWRPLVEGTWRAEELVGRHLVAKLAPALSFDQLAQTPVDGVDAFIPTLAVQGPDLDGAAAAPLLRAGDPVTLGAERITQDASGTVYLGDTPVAPGRGGAAPDPALLARIARLDVTASGAMFPNVTLRMSAWDANGQSVPGLDASAFRVDEQGYRALSLRATGPKPPRIALVLDVSGSIPPQFKDEAMVAAFARGVAERVLAQAPDAQFRVCGLTTRFTYGNWTSSPDEVAANAADVIATSSNLWAAAAGAADLGATVTVMVTDGRPSDLPTDGRMRRLLRGGPIVGVQVVPNDEGTAVLQRMAALTNGTHFQTSDVAVASEGILAAIVRDSTWRYRGTYRAPAEGPLVRTVTIASSDGRVSAQASYEVPPAAQRTETPRLAGLYLHVEAGNASVDRVLAGNPTTSLVPEAAEQHVEEVRSFPYGETLIAFEGGAPTRAAMVDDVLRVRFGSRSFYEATEGEDMTAARAAMETGLPSFVSKLPAVTGILPREDGAPPTFELGLRAVLLRTVVNVRAHTRTDTMDLLPLGGFGTPGADGAAAFATTARRTARLALAEALLFQTSTRSLLAGQALVALPAGQNDVATVVPGLTPEQRTAWNRLLGQHRNSHRLVPASGAPLAFWSFDATTGSLIGVLPDGSGGGSTVQDIEVLLRKIDAYLGLMAIGVGVVQGPAAIGIILLYGKTLANLYGQAAIVMTTLSASGADEQTQKIVFGLACEVMRSAIVNVLDAGTTDLFVQALEVLLGARGWKVPGACDALFETVT